MNKAYATKGGQSAANRHRRATTTRPAPARRPGKTSKTHNLMQINQHINQINAPEPVHCVCDDLNRPRLGNVPLVTLTHLPLTPHKAHQRQAAVAYDAVAAGVEPHHRHKAGHTTRVGNQLCRQAAQGVHVDVVKCTLTRKNTRVDVLCCGVMPCRAVACCVVQCRWQQPTALPPPSPPLPPHLSHTVIRPRQPCECLQTHCVVIVVQLWVLQPTQRNLNLVVITSGKRGRRKEGMSKHRKKGRRNVCVCRYIGQAQRQVDRYE